MTDEPTARPDLGNEPPLIADQRRRPDRRQVSARWLAGTLLTGLTSTALMGIALSAALDGRQVMARPAATAPGAALATESLEKGERVFAAAVPVTRSRRTLEVSTMIRDGDRELIRTVPLALVNMSLASRHPSAADYPAFDALKIFAEPDDEEAGDAPETGQIYGAKVETDVSLKVEPFDFSAPAFDAGTDLSAADAESLVRSVSSSLPEEKPVRLAALRPLDTYRFSFGGDAADYEPGSAFRVVEENVSVAIPDPVGAEDSARYFELIIPFRETEEIAEALAESGHDDLSAARAAARLSDLLSTKVLSAGNVLRVGIETRSDGEHIVRISVYRGETHLLTVAESEAGSFEPAAAPPPSQAVAEAFDEDATEGPQRTEMPTVYDAIYQAALAYGLNDRLCQQLLRILASDVDYQARLNPNDRLTVLYSLDEGEDAASDSSEILYVEARFADQPKRFYRFRTPDDDHVDYYDTDGRSARQFLIRNPVPNARLSSPFSTGRKHPVLGYVRPHWGVDWAAPSGTPILAAGSGVVEQAGWTSGYGRQTVIQHANGYETSYSHQSGIAKGIKPGAHVRQGQIIGYVGSTGLSTGNHLHYEVHVNGTHVDPMRIRLPSGRTLQGDVLEAFKRERDRIDKLLEQQDVPARVADRQ
ncbi:M23 family metallopeptidase [Mangrovibrevibacter kandeliae]|uniref:M23 family metallopeptidase n=1 Tax=Mangrovibrevibacter kandeliae TaxID=2968473 RepID=UPI002118E37E|nr:MULTISPECIES: M23 family metallopeptidase [unclassified Aurantimonas]MCQ8783916.1 M23 family metallopeptidase [Aurantimonas sp. CSK15Z-1]MCW4116635.1 M23 family metallopeptidase [Aurantimonas sp. MSK8Z-1]